MGSLYVIYMIIFHATEFLNMLNLLRALRFNFEEFCPFERIFSDIINFYIPTL